ncbi:MAG: DNA replication/repair protein RecF [Patescibacteria group bacterium]
MVFPLSLTQVELENFRSHRHRSLKLGGATIFVGPNGVGKTNILEAIWCLATTRPFRTSRDSELIHWEAASTAVVGDAFEMRLVREPIIRKALFIGGVPRRPLEYLGELRAVLFTPDSLAILSGPPRERRRFLDTLLAQGDRSAARELVAYRQLLVQRNALLRLIHLGQAGAGELEPWDSQLIVLGSRLTQRRADILDILVPQILKYYGRLGGLEARSLAIMYQPIGSADPAVFAERLAANRAREIALQVTLVGPHRDDFLVSLRGHPLADYGSRGEIRTVLLALKWAEYDYLARDQETRPILLLDDLFSELDPAHRQALAEFLDNVQAVITTTDCGHLPQHLTKRATIIELDYPKSVGNQL